MARTGLANVPEGRVRLAISALLVALAGVAWAVTALRMDGMESGPGMYPAELGFYVSAWAVMMAAMMFPSVWPTAALYASMHRERRGHRRTALGGEVVAFVAGYLLVWTALGLAAFALLEGVRALGIEGLMWEEGGHWVAAAVIALAAVYELTPLKDACLRRCRNPVGFLISSWRNGRLGAVRMGVGHGGWCAGCCWALMAVLFALGLMSVGWMLVIAALIAIEKLLPWRLPATAFVTAALLTLSIAVAAAPDPFVA